MIRLEQAGDHAGIREINLQAFGGNAEAELVDKLRAHGKAIFSLVAVTEASRLVGHILFSPIHFQPPQPTLRGLGLAPMAVLPEYQRQGWGTRLIAAGLAACRAANYDCVVVLGHKEYYPRFGFVPARQYHLACEYAASDAYAFMLLELRHGALQGCHGFVKYESEFDEA